MEDDLTRIISGFRNNPCTQQASHVGDGFIRTKLNAKLYCTYGAVLNLLGGRAGQALIDMLFVLVQDEGVISIRITNVSYSFEH